MTRVVLLCTVFFVVVGCGEEPEPKGIYCSHDKEMVSPDCRPYKECKSFNKGTDVECKPLEEMMGQRVAYCWKWDGDQGFGTQVSCHISMDECRQQEEKWIGWEIRRMKSCYAITP